MTDTERNRRWRDKLAEKGYKRVEVRLSDRLVKAIQRDSEYQEKGVAGCVMKAIESVYGRGK